MEQAIRKTKTSTEVKNRYNKKTYEQISFRLPPETVEAFRKACDQNGESMRSVMLKFIDSYIGGTGKE